MKNSFAVTATGKSIFFINAVRDPFGVLIISYSSYWRFSCSFGTDSRTSTFCFTISYSCASVRAEFVFREKSFFFCSKAGYKRIITYTLESEHGSSVKAVNFKYDGIAGGIVWSGKRRNDALPAEMKKRWVFYCK